MTEGIEYWLRPDPQQAIPACYCSRCVGARFAPGLRCIRCEEDGYDS